VNFCWKEKVMHKPIFMNYFCSLTAVTQPLIADLNDVGTNI